MTSSDGGIGSTTNGNAFASFLLGYPSARTDRVTSLSVSTPLNVFTHYFGGYAQDDWRINSKFTLTYGLRLEHEKGLSEKDNNFTVGFDPVMQSALSTVAIPADPVAGTAARTVAGGLMYAGVDGNKTYQGNAPAVKWSPRVGAVYALNDRTVLRGGYGLYWAPFNYPIPSTSASNYGQVGYSQNTILTSSRSNPTTFENPFPSGIALPSGNSRGALTNLDSNISFVDQNRTAPRVQQFSVDLQRQLPGNMGLTVSYMGARSDHIGLGGSNDIGVNINQLDPKYLALGSAALDAQVPNPFLNNPNVPRVAVDSGDAVAGPPAPAFPAIRPDQRPAGHRRRQPLSRGGIRAHQADVERPGRPLQLHLQPARRQPGGREQLLHRGEPGASDEQLQLHALDAGMRRRSAVHDRLLRSVGGVRPQHARRAAPRPPRADCRIALRRRASAGRTAASRIC